MLHPPFIKAGGLNGDKYYDCKDDDPFTRMSERGGGVIFFFFKRTIWGAWRGGGMMGSVVVLLHSTGQTQVISSSQERTRHSRATEDPHGERSREVSRHYNGLSSMGLKRKYWTNPT